MTLPARQPVKTQLTGTLLLFIAATALYLVTFPALSDGAVVFGRDVINTAEALVYSDPIATWFPHHLLFNSLAWFLARILAIDALPTPRVPVNWYPW